jgi:hypothetical protein
MCTQTPGCAWGDIGSVRKNTISRDPVPHTFSFQRTYKLAFEDFIVLLN